ncbi:MAG: alpha-amylase [Opitutus sp.]|nr:alpha-amylase [Opitutus sp.]
MQDFSPGRRLTALASARSFASLPMMLFTPSRALAGLATLFAAVSFSVAQPSTAAGVAVPRFTHPGAGQTVYFVLTDRFANGRADNDTGGYAGGPDEHGFDPTKISHFQGGDFAGLTAKLDYLTQLGVTAVWVTPPFKNKPMQSGTAGYHGYWITDFLSVDPHLGTNDEYREFVRQAHARGLRVYMDIIVNHTADVIAPEGGKTGYRSLAEAPYRDALGNTFDLRRVMFNGLNDPAAFPALDPQKSFAYVPTVPAAEKAVKNPAWLNDPIYYHNRGNTLFLGENSTQGDFVGLDDLFTEHPRVVQGFIDIFQQWLEVGIDGYRIDTMRHVNNEFWQAFSPAIRSRARELGRPDFVQFGEVYNDAGDPAVLAEFSTNILPGDTTIDFGFFAAARRFVSQSGTASGLADFFARDDYYTDHDSNVHTTTTFLGNHDAGRFGYFLMQDNTGADGAQLAELTKLGHGLLYLSRGSPVVYYGDEQGMIGAGGNDMQARESMFASQAPDFRKAQLLATTRTGADDKFDSQHPFYQFFARLGALRARHVALRTGAMIPRLTGHDSVAAFSRVERSERVEYVAAFNNSRTGAVRVAIPTSQPAGARVARIFDSRMPDASEGEVLAANETGGIEVTLAPLQFAVWRAEQPLAAPAERAKLTLANPAAGGTFAGGTREVDGLTFPVRREIRADVSGGDGVGEVTFVLKRASRPNQFDLLGTDDAAPYRIFWSPPADLAAGEEFDLIATFDDLRGHATSASVARLKIAATTSVQGIAGSRTPGLKRVPAAEIARTSGTPLTLQVEAEGTAPFEYQWLRNGSPIAGATNATYTVAAPTDADAGEYRVLVHNLAGTAISAAFPVRAAAPQSARLAKHASFPSQFVVARNVDVWLPPGYDANSAERYPVVYMHDGQNLFEAATSSYGIPWGVDQAMLKLLARGEVRPAIIVGVWCTAARFAEYMPQKASSPSALKSLLAQFRQADAGLLADNYLKFLVEELKPFIDRTYRTRPEREHTFIMGSSMGGLISGYAVAEYPQVFGGAGCVSTHWPAADGAVIDYFAQHLPGPGAHKLYFDFGTETLDARYEPYQQRMDAALRARGYVPGPLWMTQKFIGAEHSEKSWRERVDIPLRFLLGS